MPIHLLVALASVRRTRLVDSAGVLRSRKGNAKAPPNAGRIIGIPNVRELRKQMASMRQVGRRLGGAVSILVSVLAPQLLAQTMPEQPAATKETPPAQAAQPGAVRCGSGTVMTVSGECVALAGCPEGEVRLASGGCAAVRTETAPPATAPSSPATEIAMQPRKVDPTLGGPRLSLEAGIGASAIGFTREVTQTSASGYTYTDDVNASAGGFPAFSLAGRAKYFATEIEAVNIDIEGELALLLASPAPNKDKGTWFAGTVGIALGLTPRSTPINVALGPWLGVVSYDIDHSAAKGTNLALGGSGAVRLMFGSARQMSIGGVFRLGGVLANDPGAYTDLRLTIGYGF
jgi:hypothetical protein